MNREHYRSDGQAKVRMYEWEAKEEAARMGMTAYRCTYCNEWHIGN